MAERLVYRDVQEKIAQLLLVLPGSGLTETYCASDGSTADFISQAFFFVL